MKKFLIASFVLAACSSSSTAPSNTVEVVVVTAARPTSGFAVRNHTSAPVTIRACGETIGIANVYTGTAVINVVSCQQGYTARTIAAGAELDGTATTNIAGQFRIVVTLADGTPVASDPFTVH